MSQIFRLLGLLLFLSGASVCPMQSANFNRAVGQPPHAVASIDQLKHLNDEMLGFLRNKTDNPVACETMCKVRFVIDSLSPDEINKSAYELLLSTYFFATNNLKLMADQEGCPEIFKQLSDQMCILLEKVLIERKVIFPVPIKSFFPRTNWSKAVGEERKVLTLLKTRQSPDNSEGSWSPLSGDFSPIAQGLSSSNQSSHSSTPTPVETPRQESGHFTPISVTVTPASPLSGRGSVTHREYRFGLGCDFWRPESASPVSADLCCRESNERYPGYVNREIQ